MMKKRGLSKRVLAFVLSVMMVIALVPMNAITVKAEGVPDCPHCGGTGLVCGAHVSSSHGGQDYSNMNSCRASCIVDAKGKCAMHGLELSYECEHCKRGSACKHSLISSSVSYLANADYHWKKTCNDCGAMIDKESHTDTNNDGICDTCRYSSSSGAILPGNNNDEFKLNICNIPSEGGSTYCEKMPISYSQGTSATFTAKPNPGYRFKGWYAMKSSNASGELGTCLSSEETYTITPSAVDTYKTCDSGLSSKKTYSVYIAAVYEDSTVHTHSKGTYHEAASSTCIAAGNIEYWDCCLCEAKIDVNDNVIEDITIPREKVITSAIDTNSNGFEGEGCENLLDSNTDTKWCCSFDGETFVVIKASEPVIISNYTITTAGDTSQYKDRNPKSWTLLACNDYNEAEKKGTWEEIDSISNGDMPNENTTAKTFNISSTKKYQYYKWNVASIVGGSILQVSEFELHALHSFENNDANTHKCSFCNTTGEHDFSDGTCKGVCTVCGASNTSGNHNFSVSVNETIHKCADCDATENHVFANDTDTTCDVCGYVRTVTEEHTSDEIIYEVDINGIHHLKYDEDTETYICKNEGCDAEFEPGYYNAYGSCEEDNDELAYVLLANQEDLSHDIEYDLCTQLQVVDFRNIEKIDRSIGFKDCKSLQTVNLGRLQKLTGSDEKAIVFNNCQSLQTVDLGSLKYCEGTIFFENCQSLQSVDLKNLTEAVSVDGLVIYFNECGSLETIDLGSLKNAGGDLDFINCDSLRAVDLGKLVNCGGVYYYSAEAASVTLHEGDPCGIKTDFWGCVISYTSHTYIQDEEGHYVCSVCGHEGGCATGNHDFSTSPDKCSICGFYADLIGAKLAGYSLSLHDNIGVDFYMELADSVINDEGAKFIFKLEGDSLAEIPVSEAQTTTVNGNTYYVFECRVAAAQMTGCISAKIVLGDGTEGTEYQFTVQDYAKYILEHEAEYEEVVPVVKAMLRYGASAQNYFGYNTDSLANEILNEADRENGSQAPDLSAYVYSYNGTSNDISFVGTSLILESEVSLKCYFLSEIDLQSSNVSVKYGDKVLDTSDYQIGKNGNVQYVTVTGLTPADYGMQFTITVQDITVENVSAYGYMAQAFKQMGDSDKLTDLLKNMYAYGEAYKKCYKLL